jgi:RNA polymerase sigma factor (sigma-70 family)
VPSNETDQLQDVQRRVQLARELFIEQGEYIQSIVRYAASKDQYKEDLVQDLFLSFVARPIPDDIVNIRAYLYRVILDKVVDLRRARTRHQTKIRIYSKINAKQLTPLYQDVEQHDSAQNILGLIEKHLSKPEIKAIVLRYQNQYEIEDVARVMKINPRSVSRYISVGLKKIRQVLNIHEGAEHDEGE